MTPPQHGPGRPTRRIFLLGGLAAALGVSACGRTVVTGVSDPSAPASAGSIDSSSTAVSTGLTGSYSIADTVTGTQMDVTVTADSRVIRANGLPNHQTGSFPNVNNPNTISAQTYEFQLPLRGTRADRATQLVLPQPFGIATNGVLFDPLAAEWYRRDRTSGWTIEAIGPKATLGLDDNNAHVQPTGAYHYHGLPTAVLGNQGGAGHSPLVGWAGDGFPIYARFGYTDPMDPTSGVAELTPSYRLRSGVRADGPGGAYDGTYTEDFEYVAGHGPLDLANGRYGVTPEYPDGTYHYVLTESFPFIPRYFVGTVADGFGPAGRPGGRR
ncbi:YHYH protein [Micromonospora sp. WMMA1363]|uniref:YHYH protein n=1 Tax=Micromonospora sp. WMMA1363 TaxID=3053985 RepID=UPI00259CA2D3|nr:YHYH protein [Micromonospora sp. WMMA1363]MDM4719050.1 YHYH protein [Micromonospora sp. WMMA1363]